MRTTINIDDTLMRRAQRATGLSSKKAVVEEGLRLIAKMHRQKAVLHLRGKIASHGDLNTSRRGRAG